MLTESINTSRRLGIVLNLQREEVTIGDYGLQNGYKITLQI